MRYLLTDKFTYSQYSKFLSFAFEYSDAVGVSTFRVHKKELSQSYFDFLNSMNEFILDEYNFVVPPHYEKGQKFHIFALNNVTKNIIKKQASIFDWKYPNLPEDLTFYKHKQYWFTSITHEQMLFLNTNERFVLDFFENLGITMREFY